jgi:hypothetical protein
LKKYFESRQEFAREKEKEAQKKVDLLSILRFAAFVAVATCAWFWFQQKGGLWPWLFLGSTVVFLILMRMQQSAQRLHRFYKNTLSVNEDEAKRLDFEFVRPDTGAVFQDSLHFYSGDLDIFGKHSLFRLLNRTQTAEGSSRLAQWLSNPAPLETILERQQALSESRDSPEWRETWQATAMLHKNATHQVSALSDWIHSPMPAELRRGLKWKWWAIVTAILILAWALDYLPAWPLGFSLLGHVVLLRRYSAYIKQLADQTLEIGSTLVAYADLMALSKDAAFKGAWWTQQLGAAREAEVAFRELGTWFSRLDFRANVYFALFIGVPSLWDLICLDGLEKWKKTYKDRFPEWLTSLANIEAMNSLSGHAFANPEQVLPEVHWGNELEISARSLGHPLIPHPKRVCNDYTLTGTGNTMLITGSNMSGKSTFLRTVGLNLVMAQTGGVVVAEQMSCSLMQVFTSMRTQDSLEENTSSFYAELKRLKQLIELAESQGTIPVFYLLDEILKGTNSADRHRGAAALIKQLHPLNASGMVSTHDLELGEWGSQKDYVQNFNFTSDLLDGKITFDYKLKPGTCASFNASELMRMMGIKIEEYGEK